LETSHLNKKGSSFWGLKGVGISGKRGNLLKIPHPMFQTSFVIHYLPHFFTQYPNLNKSIFQINFLSFNLKIAYPQ
jgi:hypothetical protein